MSPLRVVSVEASEIEPASEDDMTWASPLVADEEVLPEEVVVLEEEVVEEERCLGWNSVMMTVTLLTVTALCWAVLRSTFFKRGLQRDGYTFWCLVKILKGIVLSRRELPIMYIRNQ